LPAGVTGTWLADVVTISGTPTASGTFTYTVTTSGGCPPAATTGVITVNQAANISSAQSSNLCSGTLTDIVLTSSVSGTTYSWQATLSNVSYGALGTTPNGDLSNLNQIATLINPLQVGTITFNITPSGNGCSDSSITFVITIQPVPVINSIVITPQSLTVCDGEQIRVNISGSPFGTTYEWIAITNNTTIAGGVSSGVTANGLIEVTVNNTLQGTAGSIYFQITPLRNGCYGTTLTSDTVLVNPTPGTPIPAPEKDICSGEVASLVISIANPFITGTEVVWEVLDSSNITGASGGTAIAPFTINDELATTSNSQGYVIYRVTSKLGNCEGGFTDYRINVNPLPNPVLLDGSVCMLVGSTIASQGFEFNAGNFGPNHEFLWYELSDTTNPIAITSVPTYTVFEAGTYFVIVTNLITGCINGSNDAVITETNPALAFSTTVSDAFADNTRIIVNVSGGTGVLLYQLDNGPFQESNIFTNVSAGLHTINVSDTVGCTSLTDTVLIIDYPKYFTPNGDSYNDNWNIVGLEAQLKANIFIFDRYGKLLKQLRPNEIGWDGTYNGHTVPSTDYWFTVEYEEKGLQKMFRAHFSLKR
jgi:gliding motility-associated-like protein